MIGKLAAVGLAHPFEEGYADVHRVLDETVRSLEAVGVSCLNTGIVLEDLDTVLSAESALRGEAFDAMMVCIATWSEDHHLFDLTANIAQPLILRAYPAFSTGSLCCTHQIACVLTELSMEYAYVYGKPDDPEATTKTAELTEAYGLRSVMRKTRVGSIGGRVKGMTEIACDEFGLMDKIGARVVNLNESELTDSVAAIDDAAAESEWRRIDAQTKNCKPLSPKSDVLESVKYYLAMKELVREHSLDALAVKCYTKYMGKVCLGYSLLAEEGITCSCEGDVPNALTMKMLQCLSGEPVNNTDLLYPDPNGNTILFSHCGSSGFSISAGEIELAPVRLAETGVCARFLPKTGPVTLVNLCGHGDGMRLTVMSGEAVECGMEFQGNPLKVTFKRPVLELCEDIAQRGIGHHWMAGYGDHAQKLRIFCEGKLNYVLL